MIINRYKTLIDDAPPEVMAVVSGFLWLCVRGKQWKRNATRIRNQ
jgi:hypothetical protein